jgi:hypothetical protein
MNGGIFALSSLDLLEKIFLSIGPLAAIFVISLIWIGRIFMNKSHPVPAEKPDAEESTLDVSIESPAIRRMIEEIRSEDSGVPRSYNRTFNRHNR